MVAAAATPYYDDDAGRETRHVSTTTEEYTAQSNVVREGVVDGCGAPSKRRSFGGRMAATAIVVLAMATVGWTTGVDERTAVAAPPIAIIAEELGYFPVTNADGETVYVPKRIQRPSTGAST